MILRILAWIGFLLGGITNLELIIFKGTFHPLGAIIFILGLGYFLKNGFFKSKKPKDDKNG